jgi:site-specific recombinase XerD
MAGRRSRSAPPRSLDVDKARKSFAAWLERQPLSKRTAEAYRAQGGAYLRWLAGSEHAAEALSVEAVRDWAVRDYKRAMKRRRLKPTTVNQALAAIDALYRSLNLGRPDVRREALAQVAPRALAEDAQRRFLRSVERCPSVRDRAIATLFLYTGLRLSELAALDVDDVAVSPRRGRLRVPLGKGDAYREVPLNSACRAVVDDWAAARTKQLEALAEKDQARAATDALWLARGGGRLTSRAIDLVVRRLAADAGVEVSAHVLRHTWVTNLIRSGADVVLVAELAGHRRLDTTRRYSLPSQADRDAAVEAVLVET